MQPEPRFLLGGKRYFRKYPELSHGESYSSAHAFLGHPVFGAVGEAPYHRDIFGAVEAQCRLIEIPVSRSRVIVGSESCSRKHPARNLRLGIDVETHAAVGIAVCHAEIRLSAECDHSETTGVCHIYPYILAGEAFGIYTVLKLRSPVAVESVSDVDVTCVADPHAPLGVER